MAMRFIFSCFVLVMVASSYVFADLSSDLPKAETNAIAKAPHAYHFLIGNRGKVKKSEFEEYDFCVKQLEDSLHQLEISAYDAALMVQEDCANKIKSTGILKDVKAKVEEAAKATTAIKEIIGESTDASAPAPFSNGIDSATKARRAQKKARIAKQATKEANDAYILINNNRAELDKLDPNGTDVCFKMLASAMVFITKEAYHKARMDLQECVNALATPKGQLVVVKAKTEKAIENLKH